MFIVKNTKGVEVFRDPLLRKALKHILHHTNNYDGKVYRSEEVYCNITSIEELPDQYFEKVFDIRYKHYSGYNGKVILTIGKIKVSSE